MNTKNLTTEIRIANRAKSIFAAFGQVINDFYLEAGIYFVGGFNAALVSWSIFTDLVADNQPLAYAIAIAIIAFIAVEGLAIYLVGAAARTNNGLLWFFSVIFAAFFTYAHYQEMASPGIIAQYITLMIPFFAVVGYWGKTVKIDMENHQAIADQDRDDKAARLRQLEDAECHRQQNIEAQKLVRENEETAHRRNLEGEELLRQREIEDQNLAHKLEMERVKEANKQAQKLAQIEVRTDQKTGQMNQMTRQNDPFDLANGVKKTKKMTRQNDLIKLVSADPNLGPTELKNLLVDLGHVVSISTVKRDVKSLNGNSTKP